MEVESRTSDELADSAEPMEPREPLVNYVPWLAAIISLTIGLTLFLGVLSNRPAYLSNYQLNRNPDARDYVLLGRNLLLKGSYSRSEAPPFAPDVLRTPVYPVFVGALDVFGDAGAIYLAQILLHSCSCFLLYKIVSKSFGTTAAVWSSLGMATDLVSIVTNFEAMSEPVFVFLMLATYCLIDPAGQRDPETGETTGPHRLKRALTGGVLLGLTTLTRPVSLYLIPFFVLIPMASSGWKPNINRTTLRISLAILMGSSLPVGLWIARNQALFSIPRLTTVDSQNIVYFVGAGGYQKHFGISLEEAQARISSEFKIPTYVVLQNAWITDRSVAEMDAEVRAVRGQVLLKYPKEVVISCAQGIAKAGVSTNHVLIAVMLARKWVVPHNAALLKGDASAWKRLAENEPFLIGCFAWETVQTLLTIALAVVGVIVALRNRKDLPGVWCLLAMFLYFELTIGLFGMDAYARCRVPAIPWLTAFAGLGIAGLTRGRKALGPTISEPSPSQMP